MEHKTGNINDVIKKKGVVEIICKTPDHTAQDIVRDRERRGLENSQICKTSFIDDT